jgi:hypothetical protein
MLIIVAHRILIGAAIVFGVFFSLWELSRYRRYGGTRDLVVALITILVTAAMAYYLKNLRRFLGQS